MTSNFDTPQEEIAREERMARFELLSAYLDGEVTASESQQVEQWLKEDVKMQQLHHRLLKLRRGWQSAPVATEKVNANDLSAKVFQKIDNRRQSKLWLVAGGAMVASLIGAMTSLFAGNEFSVWQTAQIQETSTEEYLAVALDKPTVKIPKAAVAIGVDEFK